jgi:hypothetical protein
MIYLLTAIGLTPGGNSTIHIYTQTVHRTTQNKQHIEQHKNVSQNACGFHHKQKWANASQLLRRIPTTGALYEHLSLVNGALAQILDAYRFPPTVGKCNTSQRNHVRLFTIQAEMFAFPPPVCTRQRDKWPVWTISMTKLVERTSHESGASLMVRCKVYLNLPSV